MSSGRYAFKETDLGPATEARFAAAFASTAILTKKAAADLIGLDVDTLDDLTADQIIRSVPRGKKLDGYTERDLRLYLLEGAPPECRSTSRPRAASSNLTSLYKGGGIMALQARKPDAQRRLSSVGSESRRQKGG